MNATALSLNPATGQRIAEHPFEDAGQLEAALRESHGAFNAWRQFTPADRLDILRRMAAVLRRDREPLARLATLEMGKPIKQSRAEVEKCAALCEWYSEHGAPMLADEPTAIGPEAYVSFHPLGPVLGVMPWNFPFWQAMRNAVPVLLAGNTYVLKPAPNVLQCSHALAHAWLEAGLPAGGFVVAHVDNELVSVAIRDKRIAAVAVTGSVRAGSAIAAQAGAALKKTVLELGGADAFIVLADADIDQAVEAAVSARFQNAGQVCIAAKRFILEAPIARAFTEKFVKAVSRLKVGDPLDEATDVGPMARYDLRDELHGQVERSVRQGAELLLGGAKMPGAGNFYAPTVLGGVRPGMVAFEEEIFGPVAAIVVAEDAADALRLANDSEFGLSAALWTRDKRAAKAMARELATGGVFINGTSVSDPRIPIGGVRKSGYGRELSHYGVREFMNAQAVWVDRLAAPAPAPARPAAQ